MRLLRRNEAGGYSLVDFTGRPVPPYAILSHTWLAEDEEPTFDDLENETGEWKPGYKKIQFTSEQAWQDGLEYCWIDTCCINRANQLELSQAIHSMFRWYQNAARCYVYMSDVHYEPDGASHNQKQQSWDLSFVGSRWFTRGWTVQELLAPYSVEFFSCERHLLGTKASLHQQITDITGIPPSALHGTSLAEFTVDQRLMWINRRQTKLAEDRIYSMLGIFDTQIPLLYGEDAASALQRLKEVTAKREICIRDLRLADPRHDKKRIEDAKGGLLEDSYSWVLGHPDFRQWRFGSASPTLWIKGDPGKGKTMLLCGIINELARIKPQLVLSYYFCEATNMPANSATAVLRGLIYMLVNQKPSLASYVQQKYDSGGRAIFEDANSWITLSEIWFNMLEDESLEATYIIIDALDECTTDLPKLLHLIVQTSATASGIKWLVSSRNWSIIEQKLHSSAPKVKLCLELNGDAVSAAVSAYIRFKVDLLAKRNRYSDTTRDAVLSYLSSHAHGTFLWVALVCQRLANISRWKVQQSLTTFPPGLDAIYERMMSHIRISEDSNLLKDVLAIVTTVYRPITIDELQPFIDLPDGMMMTMIFQS